MSVEGGQLGCFLLIGFFVLWVVHHTRRLCRTDKAIMRLAFIAFAAHAYTDNVLIATTACVFFTFAIGVFASAPPRLLDTGRGGVGTRGQRSPEPCRMQLGRAVVLMLPLLTFGLCCRRRFGIGLHRQLRRCLDQPGRYVSLKEVRRIPVLREPHHLALSPDGKSLLVGDTVGNEMLFFDPTTAALQKRLPMADPYQLGFSPNGRFLVVNGLARNQVDVYDAGTMQLLKRFPIASMPSHLDYAPDSSRVFVSLQGTDSMVAIDLNRLAMLWTAKIGKTPAGVLWHDGKVLVADMGTDYVAEVDPADGRVTGRIHTGRGAHNLFLSPDRKIIWVNNRVGGSTTVAGRGNA